MKNKRIYLDYNATSLIEKEVAEYMSELLLSRMPCNASSIHEEGRKSRSIIETARMDIAKALSIDIHKEDWQIIFTSSGTESNNLAIHGLKKEILFIGATEHVSILENKHKNKIIIPVDANGIINPETLSSILQQHQGSKLVSIMLANNETGVIQDISYLSEIIHKEDAIFHCDASQAFGKIDFNLNDLGCDLLTISAHKYGGPLGSAALVAKKNVKLDSIIKGGKQEQGFRAGTENLIAIAGFGKAAKNHSNKIKKNLELKRTRDKLEKELLKIDSQAIALANNVDRLPNTSSIRMPNVKSEEQLIKFDLAGFSLSAGSACSSGRIASSHVLRAMNIDENTANEVIRVSMGMETKESDVDNFIQAWTNIYNMSKNR